MKSYRAIFERDGRGVWLVSVPELEGCHTYGRSLEEARANLREAVDAIVGGRSAVSTVEDVRLPSDVKRAVRRVRRAREQARARQVAADVELRKTARILTRSAKLSLRDAGDLLGLSRQRIQQLVRTGQPQRS